MLKKNEERSRNDIGGGLRQKRKGSAVRGRDPTPSVPIASKVNWRMIRCLT